MLLLILITTIIIIKHFVQLVWPNSFMNYSTPVQNISTITIQIVLLQFLGQNRLK